MNLSATLESITPDKPAQPVEAPVIKILPASELQREIERLCHAGDLHYDGLLSVIGKLISGGIPHDDLINNARFFDQYISPDSETLKDKSVEDIINEHRKAYGDQVGSRPYKSDPLAADFKNVYFPSWDNEPEELPAVITLGGTPFLTHQNMAALIAPPGAGKSSCTEAVVASYINPECDSMGFKVDPTSRGILCVDTERTNRNVWDSFNRIARRSGIVKGGTMKNVLIAGMRSVAKPEKRKEKILHLLDDRKPSLLLIDGAGHLVKDTNNLEQAIEFSEWIREITVDYDLSIFVTLHPNPNTEKPRGHQGGEICREAESVVMSKKYDEDTRLLTTDFEHGKNRNNPKLTTAYRWSHEHMMFLSADYDEVQQAKERNKAEAKRGELIQIAKAVLPAPTAKRSETLKLAIQGHLETTESTAKRRFDDMRKENIIVKGADDHYRLNIS